MSAMGHEPTSTLILQIVGFVPLADLLLRGTTARRVSVRHSSKRHLN